MPNHFAWNAHATVLYVDQPIGTGWSYSEQPIDELTDVHESQMMAEMVVFLQMVREQRCTLSTDMYASHF